jgi:hypothetical protein
VARAAFHAGRRRCGDRTESGSAGETKPDRPRWRDVRYGRSPTPLGTGNGSVCAACLSGVRAASHWPELTGLGSFGNPSTRSPTILRWISAVPPQMVSDREKKNEAWRSLTG